MDRRTEDFSWNEQELLPESEPSETESVVLEYAQGSVKQGMAGEAGADSSSGRAALRGDEEQAAWTEARSDCTDRPRAFAGWHNSGERYRIVGIGAHSSAEVLECIVVVDGAGERGRLAQAVAEEVKHSETRGPVETFGE